MFGSKRSQKRGRIQAKIDFPNVQISLEGEEPVRSLKEINRMLHSIKAIEFNREYVDVDDEQSWRLAHLSEELRNNKHAVDFINEASKVEEGFRFKKISVENTKIIDLSTGTHALSLNQSKTLRQISASCYGMEKSNFLLLHIMGAVPEQEKLKIIEMFRNKLPKAKIKTVFTDKDVLGKTMIESVFFGSFEEPEY